MTSVKIGITLYLLIATVWDFRTMEIPPWMTWPPLAAVLVWRTTQSDFRFVPFWGALFVIWLLNGMGGGDVKLLMVLFGLFPRIELLYVFLVITGVGIAVVLFMRYARAHSLRTWFRRMSYRLFFLKPASRAEVELGEEPFTFFVALAGIAYVWVFA